LAGKH